MEHRFLIRGICHRTNHPAYPVKIICRNFCCRIGHIFRSFLHLRIKRHHGIKSIGAICNPLQHIGILSMLRADMHKTNKIIAVDTDGTIHATLPRISIRSIWIVWRPLIMRRKHIFHIFHSKLPLRYQRPWQIIGLRCKIRIRSIPVVCVWIQTPQHIPRTRCIVHMICIVMAAKSFPRIQTAIHGKIQVIIRNKLPHIYRTHMIFLDGKCIIQIKCINSKLIWHNHIRIIRHTACNPVMSTNGLHPPDFILIGKGNSIHFISAICFQKFSQSLNTLSCIVDIRKY